MGPPQLASALSATKFIGKHWLLNLDAALDQLLWGSPAHSPHRGEEDHQHVVVLSLNYQF